MSSNAGWGTLAGLLASQHSWGPIPALERKGPRSLGRWGSCHDLAASNLTPVLPWRAQAPPAPPVGCEGGHFSAASCSGRGTARRRMRRAWVPGVVGQRQLWGNRRDTRIQHRLCRPVISSSFIEMCFPTYHRLSWLSVLSKATGAGGWLIKKKIKKKYHQ